MVVARNSTFKPVCLTGKLRLLHDAMQDQTLADANLDRLVHNAHKIEMKGEFMRKKVAMLGHKQCVIVYSQE